MRSSGARFHADEMKFTVRLLNVRYHFAGLEDCYFELAPYRNDQRTLVTSSCCAAPSCGVREHSPLDVCDRVAASVHHVTRFYGLAKQGSAQKVCIAVYTVCASNVSQRPDGACFKTLQQSLFAGNFVPLFLMDKVSQPLNDLLADVAAPDCTVNI